MGKFALSEVDENYGSSDLPWVVKGWEPEDTGVDPLGLRQVNLDMMDRLLPGFNNVTRHVRVYTLMTWAWWKAARLLSADGHQGAWSEDMREFVERVDAVFSWSQFEMLPSAALPGSTVLPKKLDRTGPIAFNFSDPGWDQLRKSRRNSTDLLGAIQYGPSIRGQSGLHWLAASEGAFVPSTAVMPAVEVFDAAVSDSLPRCIRDPKWNTITLEEIQRIGPAWDYRKPTEEERKVFAERFFGDHAASKADGQLARRRSTLLLMLSAIEAANKPSSVADIRAGMFGVGSDEPPKPELLAVQREWRVLQLRQVQRLAVEALYIAIEAQLKIASATVGDILDSLAAHLAVDGISTASSMDHMLEAAFAPWAATPEHALFQLMDELEENQRQDRSQLPKLVLAALRCVQLLGEKEKQNEHGAAFMRVFEREVDRLPLGLMLQRLAELGPRSGREALQEIVEAWIFGQHLRWSIVRSGDGKQRLRVGLDERGWTLLRAEPSAGFAPTPDRVRSALRLCADCGLISSPSPDLWSAS